jgi:DnaJ-class molecular chaperone
MKDEKVECPKCLGQQDIFNGHSLVECTMCKGEGVVSERIADIYDPIADELSNHLFDKEE